MTEQLSTQIVQFCTTLNQGGGERTKREVKSATFPILLTMIVAFDTLEWNFIQQILHLFNFGACIKQWVKILYTNTESTVLHNGFTNDFFQLSRGVRQGCPLSPYLFILGVELLATRIREDYSLGGIKIFRKEY